MGPPALPMPPPLTRTGDADHRRTTGTLRCTTPFPAPPDVHTLTASCPHRHRQFVAATPRACSPFPPPTCRHPLAAPPAPPIAARPTTWVAAAPFCYPPAAPSAPPAAARRTTAPARAAPRTAAASAWGGWGGGGRAGWLSDLVKFMSLLRCLFLEHVAHDAAVALDWRRRVWSWGRGPGGWSWGMGWHGMKEAVAWWQGRASWWAWLGDNRVGSSRSRNTWTPCLVRSPSSKVHSTSQ